MKNTNVVEMVVSHKNDVKNGNLANALEKAVVKTFVNRKDILIDTLTDLNYELPEIVNMSPLSDEEIMSALENAHQKKLWIDQAGSTLFSLNKSLEIIKSNDNWDLSEHLVKQVQVLTYKIKELKSSGDKNFQRRLEVAEFISFVRSVNNLHQMDKLVDLLISKKVNMDGAASYYVVSKEEVHRRRCGGTFPPSAFFWKDKCYFPYRNEDVENKSSDQKEIEHEVMRVIILISAKKKEEILIKMEELRHVNASNNLFKILSGVNGFYRIETDPICDKKNDRNIIRHGGVLIIRFVGTRKIEPIDGAGCFGWVSCGDMKWWISVGNAIYGKVPWDSYKKEIVKDLMVHTKKWEFMSQEHKDKGRKLARVLSEKLYPIMKNNKGY